MLCRTVRLGCPVETATDPAFLRDVIQRFGDDTLCQAGNVHGDFFVSPVTTPRLTFYLSFRLLIYTKESKAGISPRSTSRAAAALLAVIVARGGRMCCGEL